MRTGTDYHEALRDGRRVWVMGEGLIDDVTVHPANSLRAIALAPAPGHAAYHYASVGQQRLGPLAAAPGDAVTATAASYNRRDAS